MPQHHRGYFAEMVYRFLNIKFEASIHPPAFHRVAMIFARNISRGLKHLWAYGLVEIYIKLDVIAFLLDSGERDLSFHWFHPSFAAMRCFDINKYGKILGFDV